MCVSSAPTAVVGAIAVERDSEQPKDGVGQESEDSFPPRLRTVNSAISSSRGPATALQCRLRARDSSHAMCRDSAEMHMEFEGESGQDGRARGELGCAANSSILVT